MNNALSKRSVVAGVSMSWRLISPWLNRLKVGQKIGLGYVASLGVAIAGTVTGIFVSDYYQWAALNSANYYQKEIELLSQLQNDIVFARSQQQQLTLLTQKPHQFELKLYDLLRYQACIENQWEEIKKIIKNSRSHHQEQPEILIELVHSSDDVIYSYFQILRNLLSQVFPYDLYSESSIQQAQQRLNTFSQSDTSLEFDEFSKKLSTVLEVVRLEYAKSQERLQAVDQLRSEILLTSILMSVIVANLLGLLISHAITRPLKVAEQTARRIVREQNFDLRVTIATQDEVSSLAQSLNQLIEWAGARSQALEQARSLLEQAVKERTQELTAIIDHLGDGLLVTDPSGQITRFNPKLLQLFGLDAQGLTGQSCDRIFHSDVTFILQRHSLDPTDSLTADVQLAHNRIGQALVTSIRDLHGHETRHLGSIMLVRDITVEKEVDQMKTDFISTVSHELRTPLTSVLGFAKLIHKKLETVVLPAVQSQDPKTQRAITQVRDNLNIIVAEGERLTALINDVLDIAKIESGKIEWNMQSLSIPDILHRAIATTSVLAQINGLTIDTVIDPNLPNIIGDRDRLIQVVINLLSNAIKFTPEGTIVCEASCCTDDRIVVSVRDPGIGLAPDDHPKIFEKFRQVGEVMTDKPRGTGLGLPICKQIVEHHGGHLWVESQVGKGSTFSFSLPLPHTGESCKLPNNFHQFVQDLKEKVDRVTATDTKLQKTILVVDDEVHIRQLLRQELEAVGYQVQEAANGIAAIQLLQTDIPDLIILDVMMPHINGFDLAAVLRNNPATMNIPTIILSIIQDNQRGYRLGIDRYFSKPIDTHLLLQDIKTLLSQGKVNQKVLVIDANVSTMRTLAEVLLAKGYVVAEATTGSEGIEKVLEIQPDMIIIDSEVSNPHTILKTLRFENGFENIFFILVDRTSSAHTHPSVAFALSEGTINDDIYDTNHLPSVR